MDLIKVRLNELTDIAKESNNNVYNINDINDRPITPNFNLGNENLTNSNQVKKNILNVK